MASAARTANRVVAISKGEVENSEDVDFKNKLGSASGAVTTGMYASVLSFSLSLSPSLPLPSSPPPPHSVFLIHMQAIDIHTHLW